MEYGGVGQSMVKVRAGSEQRKSQRKFTQKFYQFFHKHLNIRLLDDHNIIKLQY